MRKGAIAGLLLGGGGILTMYLLASGDSLPERGQKNQQPDEDAGGPDKTGYKLVDAMLPQLRAASRASGIPLGVLVGWIAKESGGKLSSTTPLDERGLFQLMPSESKSLGLDHKRLSTDLAYSIDAGLALIAKYMKDARALGIAPEGSGYFWRLVKLGHTMGASATKKIVSGAKDAGAAGSWEALEAHAIANEKKYLSSTKHSPSKWFPLVDKVYQVGIPFGFGTDTQTLVGGLFSKHRPRAEFADIVDPLDARRRRS